MVITLGIIIFIGVLIMLQFFSGFLMIKEAIHERIGYIGILLGAVMLAMLSLTVPLEVHLIMELLKH